MLDCQYAVIGDFLKLLFCSATIWKTLDKKILSELEIC